jgi:hypothetical protein
MSLKKNAVVIPIYQTSLSPEELFSINNAAIVLAKHDLYFVGPARLSGFLAEFSSRFNRPLRYKTFPDQYFAGIDGYNDLMLSSMFYRAFTDYQYILIAQTDSLVFRDELDDWAAKGYSYIGAPWFGGYTKPIKPLCLDCVGNGGFSLRNISDFLRVLNRPRIFKNKLMESWPGSLISNTYRYLKDYHSFVYKNLHFNIDVNEDLFWGLFVAPRCRFFTVPAAVDAVSFAFEAHPEYLFDLNKQQLPFGCHAWERYNPEFWRIQFEKINILQNRIKTQ